jgi:lysozyme family protein
MDTNFGACFAETETWEGYHVFSNNPHDPGGATYSGVTQRAYDGYRRLKALPLQSVRRMTDEECEDIYRTQYWVAARGADLPAGLDLTQYDEAVNTGPVEAAKLLQAALGFSGRAVDGVFGLETLGAVQTCNDVPGLITRVCAARLSFYHRLKTWIYFGVGWNRRDVGIQAKALAMYSSSKLPSP